MGLNLKTVKYPSLHLGKNSEIGANYLSEKGSNITIDENTEKVNIGWKSYVKLIFCP
jgi:hypothetical protein